MPELKIKRAELADAYTISSIHAESWKSAYVGMVPQEFLDSLSDSHWLEVLEGWFADKNFAAWIAYVKKEPAGCITCIASRDKNMPDAGEIISLYVRPEYFRNGYGGALLKTAIKFLSRRYDKCYLWVLKENERAKAFYLKNGFIPTGDIFKTEIMGKELVDNRYIFNLK